MYGNTALSLSKYPGSQANHLKYLYNILDYVDSHTFIDACAGMGSVSLNLPEDKFRRIIVNDFDPYIHNVWVHFQKPELFRLLEEKLLETEYNLENHWKAKHIYAYGARHTKLDLAWAVIVSHRFSRSAMPKNVFQIAGRMRGGQNECINAWQSYQKRLPTLHKATQRVEIWRKDIIKILKEKEYQNINYSFLIDPPFPFDTRKVKMYHTEWEDTKHLKFLNAVKNHPSQIIILGRPNEMYEYNLVDWQCSVREETNHMSQKRKKIKNPEAVWTNFKWGGLGR